jgi:8-oxo-dGTP pyrophosphatase MutT (NUDIX family)
MKVQGTNNWVPALGLFGGKLNIGESPPEGAVREFWEETGVITKIEVLPPRGSDPADYAALGEVVDRILKDFSDPDGSGRCGPRNFYVTPNFYYDDSKYRTYALEISKRSQSSTPRRSRR